MLEICMMENFWWVAEQSATVTKVPLLSTHGGDSVATLTCIQKEIHFKFQIQM
jgi:hypothetical protein